MGKYYSQACQPSNAFSRIEFYHKAIFSYLSLKEESKYLHSKKLIQIIQSEQFVQTHHDVLSQFSADGNDESVPQKAQNVLHNP